MQQRKDEGVREGSGQMLPKATPQDNSTARRGRSGLRHILDAARDKRDGHGSGGGRTGLSAAERARARKVKGRYKVLRMIGRGAFGDVKLVESRDDSNLYVLKVIMVPRNASSPEKQKERTQIMTEIRTLAQLRHPNIIELKEYYIDEEESSYNIAMEYAESGDLGQQIQAAKKNKQLISRKWVINWFVQCCLALRHMHEHNILHRDIKPQNIFLTHRGRIVKLGDFGIVRHVSAEAAQATTIVGTPYYFSPELCRCEPYDGKSDIWALGCVVYELMTLHVPFRASSLPDLRHQILYTRPCAPNREAYGKEIIELAASMLAKGPERRPTAEQILHSDLIVPHLHHLIERYSIYDHNSDAVLGHREDGKDTGEDTSAASSHEDEDSPPPSASRHRPGALVDSDSTDGESEIVHGGEGDKGRRTHQRGAALQNGNGEDRTRHSRQQRGSKKSRGAHLDNIRQLQRQKQELEAQLHAAATTRSVVTEQREYQNGGAGFFPDGGDSHGELPKMGAGNPEGARAGADAAADEDLAQHQTVRRLEETCHQLHEATRNSAEDSTVSSLVEECQDLIRDSPRVNLRGSISFDASDGYQSNHVRLAAANRAAASALGARHGASLEAEAGATTASNGSTLSAQEQAAVARVGRSIVRKASLGEHDFATDAGVRLDYHLDRDATESKLSATEQGNDLDDLDNQSGDTSEEGKADRVAQPVSGMKSHPRLSPLNRNATDSKHAGGDDANDDGYGHRSRRHHRHRHQQKQHHRDVDSQSHGHDRDHDHSHRQHHSHSHSRGHGHGSDHSREHDRAHGDDQDRHHMPSSGGRRRRRERDAHADMTPSRGVRADPDQWGQLAPILLTSEEGEAVQRRKSQQLARSFSVEARELDAKLIAEADHEASAQRQGARAEEGSEALASDAHRNRQEVDSLSQIGRSLLMVSGDHGDDDADAKRMEDVLSRTGRRNNRGGKAAANLSPLPVVGADALGVSSSGGGDALFSARGDPPPPVQQLMPPLLQQQQQTQQHRKQPSHQRHSFADALEYSRQRQQRALAPIASAAVPEAVGKPDETDEPSTGRGAIEARPVTAPSDFEASLRQQQQTPRALQAPDSANSSPRFEHLPTSRHTRRLRPMSSRDRDERC